MPKAAHARGSVDMSSRKILNSNSSEMGLYVGHFGLIYFVVDILLYNYIAMHNNYNYISKLIIILLSREWYCFCSQHHLGKPLCLR